MEKGGWIFISHSHKDIEKVRLLRNHLENRGFEPLMFYLKCLSDENEIEELIKREINERDWFIYVDSQNARDSKWVRTEREYIEQLTGKKVFTVDLSDSIEKQLEVLDHVTRQMKVFVSYHRADMPIMKKLSKKLTDRDMKVLENDNFSAWEGLDPQSDFMISDASRNGFVVVLVSNACAGSQYIKYEIQKAKDSRGKIIPVYIGNAHMSVELAEMIGDKTGVRISADPTDAELDRVVEKILNEVKYDSNFTTSYGFRNARIIHLPEISRIDDMTFWDCDNLECVYVPDSVIYITANAFEDHMDVLIKCQAGSYCEDYCKRHGLKYEITDSE